MSLLREYPNHFIHGLFEPTAEADFANSDTIIAYKENIAVGCLMFNRATNEFNWLAVKRGVGLPKREIARQLFENFYPTIPQGTKVVAFPNTEDAQIPGQKNFSGEHFEPARNLYREMGWIMTVENRIENYYGHGSHVYKVEWIPNPIDKKQSSK